MSSVSIAGDTSGSIILAAPAVAGGNTATLPAATGTVMVSGNMPAFSAYNNSGQSISSGTWTKIQINAEEFDTNNCFDTTTYRFTPNVAGYYQVSGQIAPIAAATITRSIIAIYKNGSTIKNGVDIAGATSYRVTASALVYCNGTTDYLELYGYVAGTSIGLNNGNTDDYFQAVLVRGA